MVKRRKTYERVMLSGLNLERALNLAQHYYRRLDVSMGEARAVGLVALGRGLDVLEAELIERGVMADKSEDVAR